AYRVSAAIIILALLAPALAVAWQWVRQRGLTTAPDDARFAAWVPSAAPEPVAIHAVQPARITTRRSRQVAIAAAIAGVIVAIGIPRQPTLGPDFTAERRAVRIT